MRLIQQAVVIKKEASRPRACVVSSYSSRFQTTLNLYEKGRYEGGILADNLRIPGGARILLTDGENQNIIFSWINESIQGHGTRMVDLIITATEGESLETSEEVLRALRSVVGERLEDRIQLRLLAARTNGLYSLHGE